MGVPLFGDLLNLILFNQNAHRFGKLVALTIKDTDIGNEGCVYFCLCFIGIGRTKHC